MSDDEKTVQAERDEQRSHLHFQCRLDPDLAMALRHFMKSRGYNANQALTIIVSQFFKGIKHNG